MSAQKPSVSPAMRPLTVLVDDAPAGGADRWLEAVAALRGGFFHTPAAIALTLPEGKPTFLRWMDGQDTAGVAVGVTRRCRLGGRMHLRLATAPALAPDVDPAGAVDGLVSVLKSHGVVELYMTAFDGAGMLPLTSQARPLRERTEYIVRLDRAEEDVTAAFSATQRRHLRRAVRSDWKFRAASPDDASRLLYDVQRMAADRGTGRGNRFVAERLGPRQAAALTPSSAPAGAALFLAEAEGDLLAAALVGWSATRAFYLRGGSTEAGYRSNVAVWLHWRIMQTLRLAGVESYNLGGTPADAADPNHAQHGLYRFKRDLGAELVACRGTQWPLRPLHLALHRAVNGLAQVYRRRESATQGTFAA